MTAAARFILGSLGRGEGVGRVVDFGDRLGNGRRRQVVVIDASPSWAELLARLVRAELRVDARWCTPDDLLLDEWDGVDVVVLGGSDELEDLTPMAKTVRGANPDAQILLLSAGAQSRSPTADHDAGVDEVVSRDATPTEFLSTLESLLCGVPRNARSGARRIDRGGTGARLTAAEARVLQHLAAGYSNDEIAAGLGVSTNTVRTHVQRITGKLGADSRLRAVAVARETGMLDGLGVSVVGR